MSPDEARLPASTLPEAALLDPIESRYRSLTPKPAAVQQRAARVMPGGDTRSSVSTRRTRCRSPALRAPASVRFANSSTEAALLALAIARAATGRRKILMAPARS